MNKKVVVFAWTFLLFLGFFSFSHPSRPNTVPQPEPQPQVQPRPAPIPPRDFLAVRLLVFKHSQERMADNDAEYAVRSFEKGASSFLKVRVLSNQYTTKLSDLQSSIEQHIRTDAVNGDTLVVHTIGHGYGSGNLHNLGQRAEVMRILVAAAEQNNQRIMWWQLSCHANSQLPRIDTLTPRQQMLFSNVASSTADQMSGSMVQGRIMERVFVAMGKKDPALDVNGDNIITMSELRNYMNSLDSSRRGDLLFARSADEPLFTINSMQSHTPLLTRMLLNLGWRSHEFAN